jgi:hypothetical protein
MENVNPAVLLAAAGKHGTTISEIVTFDEPAEEFTEYTSGIRGFTNPSSSYIEELMPYIRIRDMYHLGYLNTKATDVVFVDESLPPENEQHKNWLESLGICTHFRSAPSDYLVWEKREPQSTKSAGDAQTLAPATVAEYMAAILEGSDWDAAPDLYETEDDGLVLDFATETGRIVCIFRRKYAHVLAMVGGKTVDKLFEGDEFSLPQVKACLESLLETSISD